MRTTDYERNDQIISKSKNGASLGELAKEYGVSRERIHQILHQDPSKPRKPSRWTEDVIAVLGTKPDRLIAEALGVERATVTAQRKSRGIAPHRRWAKR